MRVYHVDSFTTEPFRGNPAAVCLLDGPRAESWMQAMAAEMNLSETAFVWRRDGEGFGLRWFTPAQEAALCGHATLATAQALWGEGEAAEVLAFHTQSGLLTAERGEGGRILLDFPAEPAHAVPDKDVPPGLAAALGAEPVWVGRNRLDFLVEVAGAGVVRGLTPHFGAVAEAMPARGVIVTARSDIADADFVSRFFTPATGIDEDPVTGSAHCALGPFWGERLGKTDVMGYQASARGGYVGVRMAGERVVLSGHAVTVTVGELRG